MRKKKVEMSKMSSILEQSQTEKQQVNHICTNVEGKSFIVWIFRPWKKKNQAKICLLAKMLHSNSWTVGE